MSRRLKILMSAYACHPAQGSESAVGWGWSTAIAAHHDVWVLTSSHNREGIEAALDREPGLRTRFHPVYVPPFRWLKAVEWIERRIWPPIDLFVYKNVWQRRAFREAARLHREIGFDLAHNLTYVGFRVPGFLWKLGIPFVWGPIGGLEQTNLKLLDGLGFKARLHYAGRNLFNAFDKRFRPGVRRAMRAAGPGLIAATSGIRDEIRRVYGLDSNVICEVGLPPTGIRPESDIPVRQPGEPLRLAWIGNLLPGKALPHFFRAMAGGGGECSVFSVQCSGGTTNETRPSSSSSCSFSFSNGSRTRTKDEDEDERTIGLGLSDQVDRQRSRMEQGMSHDVPDSSSSSSSYSNSSSDSTESRTRTKDEDEQKAGLDVSTPVVPLLNPDTLNPASSAQGAERHASDWTLDVVGDGPEERRWREQAAQAGLADRIRWHGRVPRARALEILRSSHVLVVTSVYDLTSTVVIEALANGVPVVCPDHCGFRDAVTPECGIRVPAPDARTFTEGLSHALVSLLDDDTRRKTLAGGALRRARDYGWTEKGTAADRLYGKLAGLKHE